MMSVPAEGTERLAEIFREMLALSETSRANHSQSTVTDDSGEVFDTQSGNGSHEICTPRTKQAGKKPGVSDSRSE